MLLGVRWGVVQVLEISKFNIALTGQPLLMLRSKQPCMVTNDAWVSTSVKSASIRTIDLSSVSTIDNQPTVYVRLVDNSTTNINAGTVATSGSDRVDSVTVTANSLLPIELASFTGIARGNAVELSWKTATEVNNYGLGFNPPPCLYPPRRGGN